MEQITYISTSRQIIVPSDVEVRDILEISRRNNVRDGLTGLLVVGGRRFLQVLEGPGAMLDETYRRIRADPRHFALVELGRKPITTRSFPDWAMGHQHNHADDLVETVLKLTSHVADPSLRTHLVTFAEMHRRAA